MKITVAVDEITQVETPALVVNLMKGVTEPGGATGAVDKALDGAISRLIQDGEIKGNQGSIGMLHTMGKIAPQRVVVVGLGPVEKLDAQVVRQVSGGVARYLRQRGIASAATIAHGAGVGGLDPAASGQAIAEGVLLGLYKFESYLSTDDDRPQSDLEDLVIIDRDPAQTAAIRSGVAVGQTMAEGAILARDMVNEPANVMTPTQMAETAGRVAGADGLSLTVFETSQMREMGMGALLGVAQGSDQPPKLIVLDYKGDPERPENNLGLVGKGITFDTGGISLKQPGGMEAMKGDMAGGASVIAAMQVIARLKPKINVTGIVAATENMPSGSAQRPGDVVRAMNGKTIEVINTDAEGRLVLADALCWAREKGITRLVDVATLTGAMVVALGKACTGVMGNDQSLTDHIVAAGDAAGEKFWQLPMFDEYKALIKSDVADMKNSGGRQAGSITAALLLAEFVDGAAWVHLDIAGTSTAASTKGYQVKGASGVPVRTLAQLACRLAEESA